ncbi:HAD family phosphatase [Actinokineospora sp. UTMC 2448]|uniref:HAD family hydrolase n=1 Tax=Actinokineospora sp. UTMC 2448 TaxID=2268449 RepID=UPI0021644D22|nr:beta-phosphoglucomutase family hydrolase [Actinokineospora sp. UTMC 2448]UVS79910.1 putative glycosyl hydrolase [Actinokineospora sp. UTMC 2448]
MIGLPDSTTACLFDLDGVLTSTATLHEAAWRKTFDGFLAGWPEGDREPFTHVDYLASVDGRPRADGVRTFLATRGITLPEGTPDDSPELPTVHGVGNRKNELLLATIEEQGVEPYAGSVAYLKAARDAGLAIGVVTSSANGEAVLASAHLTEYVQARVDGVVIARDGLAGKPAPDSFLAGARALGASPERTAVFEDAISGVEAGTAGGFGYVVGVNRAGTPDHADALRARGADIVVDDLADLLGAP